MHGEKMLYTLEEVCTINSIGKKTIKVLMDEGVLPYFRVGRKLMFHRDELTDLRHKLKYKQINLQTERLEGIE